MCLSCETSGPNSSRAFLLPEGWPIGGLASLRGVALFSEKIEYPRIEYGRDFPGRKILVHEPGNMRSHVWVHCGSMDPTGIDGQAGLRGRVYYGASSTPPPSPVLSSAQ